MSLKLSIALVFFITALSMARVRAFDLNTGFKAQAGGGMYFDADFNKRSGGHYSLGVSCLKEKDINFDLREGTRVDLWLLSIKKKEVTALSTINITKNIDEPFILSGIWEF